MRSSPGRPVELVQYLRYIRGTRVAGINSRESTVPYIDVRRIGFNAFAYVFASVLERLQPLTPAKL